MEVQIWRCGINSDYFVKPVSLKPFGVKSTKQQSVISTTLVIY